MLNKVILMGRLVRDPESRYSGDRKVAKFTLAVERDRKNAAGERETDFIDCAVWGARADFVMQWFAKGMLAIVVGRLQTNRWEDRNGNKRVSVSVQADEVNFGETKKARSAAGTAYRASEPVASNDFAELPDDDSDVPF